MTFIFAIPVRLTVRNKKCKEKLLVVSDATLKIVA